MVNAPLAELVDALDLGSSAARRESSSLLGGTIESVQDSYSGNTSAFQADARSSILLSCSKL